MKIAVIDKFPVKFDYKQYFNFEFELFHLVEQKMDKILKADVTLQIDLDEYDLVVLIGAEPAKFVGISGVSGKYGALIDNKFICLLNPGMIFFKPEAKDQWDSLVRKLNENIATGFVDYTKLADLRGIQQEDELIEYLSFVLESDSPVIAIDCETSALNHREGYLLGVSLSHKLDQGVYIDSDCFSEEAVELLQKIVDTKQIVGHNMKFDRKWIGYHLGIKWPRVIDDTMAMHYVLDETAGTHGLKQLAVKFTKYGNYEEPLELFKADYKKRHRIKDEDFSYEVIPFEVMVPYACLDTAITLELYYKFKEVIYKNEKLTWVYENLMRRGLDFLTRMEEVGVPFDRKRLEFSRIELDKHIEEAKTALYNDEIVRAFEEAQGDRFNPGSTQQLRRLLFDWLKLPNTGKLTGTGALSTDAEVLEELAQLHPVPGLILEYRKRTKLLNTYVEKVLSGMDRDGRLRTGFNLTTTTSGRLSSSGTLNMQQLPRDSRLIKGSICAPTGYSIVTQDLATAEMYYAAVLSGDKNLQSVFTMGGDFHSAVAKLVFNLDCDVSEVKEKYPQLRQGAKAVSFGILYGAGKDKVAETAGISIHEAQEVIEDYFKKFSKLKKWLESSQQFIKQNGFIYSALGRKRRLKDALSKDRSIAGHAIRSGVNATVQSLASDINLIASMDTQDVCDARGLDAKIFALVHDAIVAIVKDEHVEEYCEILRKETQKDVKNTSIPGCPVGVDQEVGKDYSFGKFDKEYGEEFAKWLESH